MGRRNAGVEPSLNTPAGLRPAAPQTRFGRAKPEALFARRRFLKPDLKNLGTETRLDVPTPHSYLSCAGPLYKLLNPAAFYGRVF